MCKEKYINIQTGEELGNLPELNHNSLIKVKPELWVHWNFHKNQELNIDLFKTTKGSHLKCWWICDKCNSDYDMTPPDKIRGQKCPYCRRLRINHTNSLSSLNPELASEWHPTKNGTLTPREVSCGSKKKVWWQCSKNKHHVWEAVIHNRNKGNSCPFCAGKKVNNTNSLASLRPDIAKYWHHTKNNKTPNDITCGSSKKVWWQCELGHEYEAKVDDVVKSNGCCSYCNNKKVLKGFNDMWTTNPELASMLADPEDGYKYMQCVANKVDWLCSNCKTVIKNKSINNVNKQGICCHVCNDNMSFPEKLTYQLLTNLNISFDYDKSLWFSNGKRYDFIINGEIIIELNGIQHYEESPRGRTLKEEQENDKLKLDLAMRNGISEYIIIDCRKSDFDFIKNNILNSKLPEVISIDSKSFNDIDMSTSLIDLCWNLKVNKNLGVVEISKKLNIGRNRVSKYLKIKENYMKNNTVNYLE